MHTQSDCIDHGRKGFGLGYATAWLHGRTTTLHRKVFYETTGELPDVVRHTCDNARCINPAHLLAGTQVDNMRDMVVRGRRGDSRNFGEANGRTILTAADRAAIRATYIPYNRECGIPALSRRFGVGTSQIWRVLKADAQASPVHDEFVEGPADQGAGWGVSS